MNNALTAFLYKRRYELLLAALVVHLFAGIVVRSQYFMTVILWPVNMLFLGLAGYGVFARTRRWKAIVRNVLFLPVLILPFCVPYFRHNDIFFGTLSLTYLLFFAFIFRELILFLIKPGYINIDIISAAACGYLLLVEIATFLFQWFYFHNKASFRGIDDSVHTAIFHDFTYFSSITITSIGFGDITPSAYYTKLLTALFGIGGQFYSVVLVGIVISKFVSRTKTD